MKVFIFDLLPYGKHFDQYKASKYLPYPLGSEELQGLLQRSHQLVVSKLPKRTQVGLLL